jgi:hypothetical protein
VYSTLATAFCNLYVSLPTIDTTTAEEQSFFAELIALIRLVKKLPFDNGAVKETEIGRAIKKLLKLGDASKTQLNAGLLDDVI